STGCILATLLAAGAAEAATIQGRVFDDANDNGIADDGEVGIPGVTVTAIAGPTTTTDAAGNFVLAGLPVGTTTIRASGTALDTFGASTGGGRTQDVDIADDADDIAGIDFGFVTIGEIIFDSTALAGAGITSQDFTDLGGIVISADDFEVPACVNWRIFRVNARGSLNTLVPTETNIYFYENLVDDGSNIPDGDEANGLLIEENVAITDITGGNLTVDLPTPLPLDGGTMGVPYWVGLTPVLPFGGNAGRWFWSRTNASNLSEYRLLDVENVFGAGFTSWTIGTEFNASLTDLAFNLVGVASPEKRLVVSTELLDFTELTSQTFTVALGAEPCDDVTVAVSSSVPGVLSVMPTELEFTAANWDVPQDVTVTFNAAAKELVPLGDITLTATSTDAGFDGDMTVIPAQLTETLTTNVGVRLPDEVGEAEGTSNQRIIVARDSNEDAFVITISEIGGTAVPGEDFVSVDGTRVSFAAGGEFVKSVRFATINDDLIEDDESHTFAFSTDSPDVTFTRETQLVTIIDDDMETPPMPDLAQVILRRTDTFAWDLYLLDGFTPIDNELRPFTNDPAWTTRAVTDLNGDGVRDLLLRNDATGAWQVYYLDGPTGEILFRQDLELSSDLADVFQAAGDMDGDGLGDVLTRHAVTGEWTAWYLLDGGAVVLSLPLAIDVAATTETRALGDLDGDGADELLLRDATDNRWTRVDFAAGTGEVAGKEALAMTPQAAWRFQGVGDLDGDGAADVLLRRTDNQKWLSYAFDATGAVSDFGRIRMTPREAWTLQQLDDFDRDGSTDALLRRSDNGRWFLYRLDGRTILESGGVRLTTDLVWETQ
ncbi:MAG: SdrD B-like domain-containing protein, partial [Pseudomonadota bacterium]